MPASPPEPFGIYLRKRRLELDLSQQEVSEKGGLSQTTLSGFESTALTAEPKVPSRKMVRRIAKGLGVPLEEVEAAAGLTPGGSLPPLPIYPTFDELERAVRRPVKIPTGDVIYLAEDDPSPAQTLVALEVFLSGWRMGWHARADETLRVRVTKRGQAISEE